MGGQRNQRDVLVQRGLNDHVGRATVAHIGHNIQPSCVQQRSVRLQIALGALTQQLQRMSLTRSRMGASCYTMSVHIETFGELSGSPYCRQCA